MQFADPGQHARGRDIQCGVTVREMDVLIPSSISDSAICINQRR